MGSSVLWLLLLPTQLVHCSSWSTEHKNYGSAFVCSTDIHIETHTEVLNAKHTYQAYASADGINGDTTDYYDHTHEAREMAVYLLFSESKLNSCNCHQQYSIINDCELSVKTCFNFKSSDDVPDNKVQYETWVNHSIYQSDHYCDYNMTTSIQIATQYFMDVYPSCFTTDPTSNPTPNPTIHPTPNPSIYPTLDPTIVPSIDLNACQGCIKLDGKRCLSGYQLHALNNNYCEPCPQGLAGHDGMCEPCKWNQEPTSLRTSCEDTTVFKIVLPLCLVVLAFILGIIGRYYWKYCEEKRSSQNNEEHIENNINELVPIQANNETTGMDN